MKPAQANGRPELPASQVLMTTPSFDTMGGIQVFAETLARALPARVQPLFVGARNGERHPLRLLLRIVRDTSLFVWRGLRMRGGIVHINTSLATKSLLRDGVLLLLGRLLRKRVLVFVHGWSPHMEKKLRRSGSRLFAWTFGQADLICVLAERFAVTLRELGVRAPIVKEATFIDDELILQLDRAGSPGAGRRIILFLSRALRSKGIFVALEVYQRVKPFHPDLALVVGGDGPDRCEAEEWARAEGLTDVRFVGHVTGQAKVDLLASATVFLFPSSYGEGLPISLLEAMAAGLPVVTTRQGGIPDFFEDTRMGESLDEPDPARFAEIVNRFLSSPDHLRSVGQYNRQYARARFTAAGAAERFMSRYKQLEDTT